MATESANLGSLLRRFRLAAALSQEELAGRSGVSVRTISDLERGVRETARFETVRMLSDGLALSISDRAQLKDASIKLIAAAAHDPRGADARAFSPLPVPPNRLIGRRALIEQVVAELEREPRAVVTLTGPGGVGKTRVAIDAASELAPRRGLPVVFVPLLAVPSADLVETAIAQALGLKGDGLPLRQRLQRLLAGQRPVLVLDNFEHLIEAAPIVAHLREIAGGALLVTSRARLHIAAERELHVEPLALPKPGSDAKGMLQSDAVRLFLERAASFSETVTLNEEQILVVADICQRLDGLPLAIELAASRVGQMSLSRLRELLDRRLVILTRGPRDQPDHQQSMRGTINWSYELLDPVHRQLFRWLSVYVGDFSAEAVEFTAEAVGLAMGAATFDAFGALLESGLVLSLPDVGDQKRFRMLETIREFGQEELGRSGDEGQARDNHAAFILKHLAPGTLQPWGKKYPAWVQRVDADAANGVAAFEWLCRADHHERCAEIAAVLGAYWEYRGPFIEGAKRLQGVLHLLPAGPFELQMAARVWAASLSMYSGLFDDAASITEESLTMAREHGDRRSEARFLQLLGWNDEVNERWEKAASRLEEAATLWRTLEEVSPLGYIYMLLGGIEYVKENYAVARDFEQQSLAIHLSQDDRNSAAGAEWYLGFIDVAEGNLGAAARHFTASIELWMLGQSHTHLFKPFVHLADVAAMLGAFELAAEHLGIGDHLISISQRQLFAFDTPSWERASLRCRSELGDTRFDEIRVAAGDYGPSDWLRLAAQVIDCAEAAEREAGLATP